MRFLLSFSIFLALTFCVACKQDASKPTAPAAAPAAPPVASFFTKEQFLTQYEKEVIFAESEYKRMRAANVPEFGLVKFAFEFEADSEQSLQKLAAYLKAHYPYSETKTKQVDQLWKLNGNTQHLPMEEQVLTFWALDMLKRGHENDCRLSSYGAIEQKGVEYQLPELKPEDEEDYGKFAQASYKSGDLSGAIMHYTLATKVNPKNPNSYYARAIVKDALLSYQSALADYNEAIKIAPDFASAYMNRGILKDENQDFQGAISDFDKVIALTNGKNFAQGQGYFNRANTRMNLKDKTAACADYQKALELGIDGAKALIATNCK
jgi:tetratricopeptide (TPR) repeat protein